MKNRISIDPDVCHGKPVIAGTRVLVSTLLGALAGGDSIEKLLEDYPILTRDDIRAVKEFANRLASVDSGEMTPEQLTSVAELLFLQLEADEATNPGESYGPN